MNMRKALGLALLYGAALFTIGSGSVVADVQSLRGMQDIDSVQSCCDPALAGG